MRGIAFLIVAAACVGPVLAQQPAAPTAPLVVPAPTAAPFVDCKQALTQSEMNVCADLDFKAADARLNALYQQLMAKYDVPNQALLRAAEEKWIGWRDSECAYETALTVGGTIHPMMELMCDTQKTQAHIRELERELACQEGDITCNPPG
ncbi:MAG: lysozyme inhibitor LprI family protein [Rhizomicrobium sp.]